MKFLLILSLALFSQFSLADSLLPKDESYQKIPKSDLGYVVDALKNNLDLAKKIICNNQVTDITDVRKDLISYFLNDTKAGVKSRFTSPQLVLSTSTDASGTHERLSFFMSADLLHVSKYEIGWFRAIYSPLDPPGSDPTYVEIFSPTECEVFY